MRRSTTSVVTESPAASRRRGSRARRRLGALLGAELLSAVLVLSGPQAVPAGPALAAPAPGAVARVAPALSPRVVELSDGRTAHLIDLGAADGGALLDRIAAELPAASAAVTGFWGPEWPRSVPIVVAGSGEQFAVLAGGGADVAATTTAQRITFSPAAAAMTDHDLRIVLRHELFHYAAREQTAADAPVWLTEGVADYVGRPPAPAPSAPAEGAVPTDAELGTAGPQRSAAYDRAWSFATYIADTYGEPALRELYLAAGGHGHRGAAAAVRDSLGVEWSDVLTGWRQWRPDGAR